MLKRWFHGTTLYRRQSLLEQLEERIVLDAAGGADAQNTTENAETHTEQTEAGGQSSDTSDATEGSTASAQSDDPLAEVFDQDLSVALISNALAEVEALQAASVEDAYVIVYDADSANLADVVAALRALVEVTGQEIGQLAILSHGQEGALILGDTSVETLNSIQDDGSAWQDLASILSDNARIDLYGCHIGRDDGVDFVQAVAQATGATVWASDDKTGGTDGDWDLEVHTGESDRGFLIDGSELDDLGVSLEIISPVANDPTDTLHIWENAETTITVTGYDGKDPNKGDVTFAIVSDPSHGTLVLGDLHDLGNGNYSQDYQYTPDTGYTGTDSFEFTINTPYVGPWQGFDDTLAAVDSTTDRVRTVQLGDIDNDGDLDAIVGGCEAKFKIYINDGDGNFTYVQGIGSTASEDYFVELGDFNNDGYLDFIGGGHYWSKARVYLNDGTGTFSSAGAVDSALLNSPGAKVGDVNGDGYLDIVVANLAGVSGLCLNRVYLNDGDGSFTYEGEFGLDDDRTQCIDMGDIDNDGDLDVVIGTETGGRSNQVWKNDGTGSFTLAGYIDVGTSHNTRSIKLGDLDGDGDLDVVTGNWGSWNRVYMNDGAGAFSYSSVIATSNDDTTSIQLGDVDNDGDLDVIAGNYAQVNEVYLNNGSGSFSSPRGIDSGTDATYAIALGDVDNDGDLDVVAGNDSSLSTVTFNNGRDYGNPPFVMVSQTEAGSYTSNSIQLGDVDNDGDLDLISGNNGVNTVYINDGSGLYTLAGDIGTDSHTTYSIQFGDVDKDGDLDVIAGNDGVNRVYFNNGYGAFLQADSADIGTDSDTTYSIQFGDVDNDGDLDVIAGNDGVNRVYFNNGYGAFLQADSADIGTDSDTTYSIQFGDVDNDGDLDLVAGNDGVNRVYLNNGSGVFTAAGLIGTHSDTTYSIQLADVDNDGDLDVVAGNDGVNRVYLNDGDGAFTDGGDIGTDSDTTYSIQLVDEDHDGDLDVVSGNQNEPNRLYLNDGAGNFTYTCDITSDDSDTRSIQAYDVNSDGITEFVVGGHGVSHTVYARDAIESSAAATVTMTIDPINHEPVYTGPTTVTPNEDVPLEITFSGEDGDDWTTQDLTFWLKGGYDLSNGDLYETESDALNRTNPIDLSTGDVEVSWGTSVWYMSDADINTGATFELYITDDGGTEGGGDDTSRDYTIDVTVQPVNDEPSYTGPTTISPNEDVPVQIAFSGDDGDPEDTQPLTYWLKGGYDLTNGDLYETENDALNRTNPIDLSSDDVEVSWGTSVWYRSDEDINTGASFELYVTDGGGTDRGGDDTSQDYTINVTVQPVNDEPSYTGPTTITSNEDVPVQITFSGDDGDPEDTQTLTYWLKGGYDLTNGDLYETESDALNRTNPIDLSSGDVEVSWGTSVWYRSDEDINTGATFELYITDDGGTDRGGDDTSRDYTIDVTVQPVNDEPSYTGPTAATTDEETPVEISFTGDDGDADAVQDLTYHLCGGSNLTNGYLYMTEADAIARVNAIDLSSGDVTVTWGTSVWYVSDLDNNTDTSFRLYVTDSGGTANGGDNTSPDYTVNVTVDPVNDPPVLTIPGPQQAQEDSTLTITGLSVVDVDVNETLAPNNTIEVTLPVVNGTITLLDSTLVSFTVGDGKDDATMTFSGTLDQVNAAIDTIKYTPTPDYNGEDEVTIVVSDLGHSGSGGSLVAQDAILITVRDQPEEPPGLPGTYTDSWTPPGPAAGGFSTSTTGPAPEIGELITFLSTNNLLPTALEASAISTLELGHFEGLMTEALLGEDQAHADEAWNRLLHFIGQGIDSSHEGEKWLTLQEFLEWLRESPWGTDFQGVTLLFGADVARLIETFHDGTGQSESTDTGPDISFNDANQSAQHASNPTSMVFDMADVRMSDIYDAIEGLPYVGCKEAPSAETCVSRVFDLRDVSFMDLCA